MDSINECDARDNIEGRYSEFMYEQDLEMFSNKKRSIKANLDERINKKFEGDKVLYKKRIIDFTKRILNNEPIDEFLDIREISNAYFKTCISLFKLLDKSEIIQKDISHKDAQDACHQNSDNIYFAGIKDSYKRSESQDNISRTLKPERPNDLAFRHHTNNVGSPFYSPDESIIEISDFNDDAETIIYDQPTHTNTHVFIPTVNLASWVDDAQNEPAIKAELAEGIKLPSLSKKRLKKRNNISVK